MFLENEIFKRSSVDFKKLEEYGFRKDDDNYVFEKNFLNDDFRAVITVNNEGSYSLDVDFVSFLNHKIVEKRYDYNEAKQRMYSELRDSDYMASYKEVLKRVINQWGF